MANHLIEELVMKLVISFIFLLISHSLYHTPNTFHRPTRLNDTNRPIERTKTSRPHMSFAPPPGPPPPPVPEGWTAQLDERYHRWFDDHTSKRKVAFIPGITQANIGKLA